MSRQLSLFPDLESGAEGHRSGGSQASRHGDGSRSAKSATREAVETVASDGSQSSAFRRASEGLTEAVRTPVERLRHRLAAGLKDPLAGVVLTDNRRRIISARPTDQGLAVRIHRSFLEADEPTLRAVAIFLNSSRGEMQRTIALQVIRSYFDQHRPATDDERPALRLRPQGRHVDLRQLRERLNKRYFEGSLEVHITWGQAPRVRRRRGRGFSILLGSYTEADRLVRIHPCLDRADVPEYVVESVVYHEMLHAALPSQRRNGRRRLHTPEFRRREQLYHHAAEANHWLEANLSRLAASR